jgi:alanine-synthesizing transaminase
MRRKLLAEGATELRYEIREIVKKADKIRKLGQTIYWENIGDPIQKNNTVPEWIKDIVGELVHDDRSYSYCPSKGVLATREYLAAQTNALAGAQITPEDILFFNGLGDAISTVYQYFVQTSRVIGPSPAYSTHSSAEAANAASEPITYRLDPENHWYPDLEDLRNKVRYNPNIAGILVINPDNPTGMVYPREILEQIVQIAKEFDLFILSDEIYSNIVYNGAESVKLAEVIGEIPGIAMKGISKEVPWPGSRCGWLEFYNRDKDAEFNRFVRALENAKMIEVCSTTLPQLAIPRIFSDARFETYRRELNADIGRRSQRISEILGEVPELIFNPTYGAFYNTIVFRPGVLKPHQKLKIQNPDVRAMIEDWVEDAPLDFRFVYYLLGSKGICVVPLSSFCSELHGFRVTLLEENQELLEYIFTGIRDAVKEFLAS